MKREPEVPWIDHPGHVPEKFSIVCRNLGTTNTYSAAIDGEFSAIGKAFSWSMIRRASAVGHESRLQLGYAVRMLCRFILEKHEKARAPVELDAALLRRYSRWLKDESGLTYKTGSTTFRILKSYMTQWHEHPWAPPNFQFPAHEFPKSNRVGTKAQKKGYEGVELRDFAACVLSDLEKMDAAVPYVPKYLGADPPLEDVFDFNLWQSLAYRTWWWEEHCGCQCLSAEKIRTMPQGESMVFGGPNYAELGRTRAEAQRRLEDFYDQIGAGPEYVRRHIVKPTLYRTRWAKPEYVLWYWENHCGCRWLDVKELQRDHRNFYVALREHHGGYGRFLRALKIADSTLTVYDLCPLYVGLLLTTALNPSTIQRLTMDCLVKNALEMEKDSIAWKKLRAGRSGLTIPARSLRKLSPTNLVKRILDMTASIRGDRRSLFCVSNDRSRSPTGPCHTQFSRAIRRWFSGHGLTRSGADCEMLVMHAASNFRPAIARHSYEATGSLLHVQTLLGHKRAEVTVNYIGRLPADKLIVNRALHINAIFMDAIRGREEFNAKRVQNEPNTTGLTETLSAHCADILHSPVHGQRAGVHCTQQNACLSCRNLVVTHSDLIRYFAAKSYYLERVRIGAMSQEAFDALMSERIYMFEQQVVKKYDGALIFDLQERARLSPPSEYSF